MGRKVRGKPKSIRQILCSPLSPQIRSFSSHIACSQSSRQTDFPNFLGPKMSISRDERRWGSGISQIQGCIYVILIYNPAVLSLHYPVPDLGFKLLLRKYDMHQGLIWVFPFNVTLPFPGSGAGFLLHPSFPCLTPGRWMQPSSKRADLCCETQ